MTAWISELEPLYSLDVNRKGYSGLYALPRLCTTRRRIATALPMRLVVIASEARQSSIVSVSFSQA